MAGDDSNRVSTLDTSGLRISRNKLQQIGPSFLMAWPGCPRNEATAVFRCDCGGHEVYKVRDVYRAHAMQCLKCNEKNKATIASKPRRKTPNKTRTDVISKQRGPHPEYWTWTAMRARCHNPRAKAYGDYGARGIIVCERWRENFSAFLEDMGPRPSQEYSIDRIDPDGNYEPDNCRWVTIEAQSFNKRKTVKINGKSILDISLETGLSTHIIRRRYEAGWNYERIVSTPVMQTKE